MTVITVATATAYTSILAVMPYETGTISTPRPAATLSHAVLMLVGRKNSAYSSTLDSGPHVCFSLAPGMHPVREQVPQLVPHTGIWGCLMYLCSTHGPSDLILGHILFSHF